MATAAPQLGYIFTALAARKPKDVDTKLMNFIESEDISKATTALADGANPNYCCDGGTKFVTGDTPLHIAARNGSKTLVKLLIIFDANPNLKNQNGETPLQVAKDDCREIIEKVLTLRKNLTQAKHRKTAKPPPKLDDDDVFLLCLDGGGIRGLVFIQAVIELDKRRDQLYPGSEPFLSYFNWIAGNSTGGIAALALATGKDPINGRQMYFKLKDKVFKGRPPFDNDAIKGVLQHTFGSETTMSEIKDYNVAVMTTLAKYDPPKLHIMRTYGGPPDDGQVGPDKRRIWEAARATSAAVPYFHPFGDFIDGGFIANNPTVDALVDIQSHFKKQQRKANVKAVISLGCGYVEPKPFAIDTHRAEPDPESRSQPFKERIMAFKKLVGFDAIGGASESKESIGEKIEKGFKELHEWIDQGIFAIHNGKTLVKILELCVSQTTQPSDEMVTRGQVFAEAIGAKFKRVNPNTEKVSLIESDDNKLIDMLYTTVLYMLEHYEEMDQVLEAVMEN